MYHPADDMIAAYLALDDCAVRVAGGRKHNNGGGCPHGTVKNVNMSNAESRDMIKNGIAKVIEVMTNNVSDSAKESTSKHNALADCATWYHDANGKLRLVHRADDVSRE